MSDTIPPFSETANWNRVTAGFKGPQPYFANPLTPQPMTIVDGIPAEVKEKLHAGPMPAVSVGDPWVARRNNSTMK